MRSFGAQRALDGLDLSLPAGRTTALFGPNGAGKTTLLRILAGGLRPTAGEVRFDGAPLDLSAAEWRRRVGVLSHQGFLYGHLTARENLRFFGALYDLSDLADRVEQGLEAVGLASRAGDLARTYSRGMRQRLALARTLLHDPEIVLLDEPYTGLDAHAAGVLRDVLATLRDGQRTVLLVTHNLVDGLESADRVAIQVAGRIVRAGDARDFDASGFHELYRTTVEGARMGAR